MKGSIINLPFLRQTFEGIDGVFHEAAIPSVQYSILNPLITHEINSTGTLNVLIALKIVV